MGRVLRIVVSLLFLALVSLHASCIPGSRVVAYGGSWGTGGDGPPPVEPVMPRATTEGTLYLAKDGAKTAFPLTRTEVSADVRGAIVSTHVTQRFENPYAERIEVTYVFPLPNRAAVDAMEMHVGKRVVVADVRPRAEARAAYQAAAAQGQHAALLEEERPNVFTFSVANIEPGSAIEVSLHYFEVAKYDHGTFEMAFPMTVGPRYIPASVADAERITTTYVPPSTRSGHTVGLSVHVEGGAPLEALESPAHQVDVSRPSRSSADVALARADEIPNRDFVLRWRLAAPTLATTVFATRPDPREPGYLALMLEPRRDPPPDQFAPRELFFLLDTSGSMGGAPLDTSVAAVRRALATMHPSDTFQIIDFADEASSFAKEPLENTPENVERANAYLEHLAASGGTNQLAGIHAALSAPGDDRRLRYVVFMTDGYIGNESEVIELVRREVGTARIFGFGVGSSVNRYLLDEVSSVGRGAAEYLRPNEDPRAMVERFYRRIGQPYLTDVTVDWGALDVSDTLPARIPDLSAFEPLLVYGRYAASGEATVTVRGRIAGRPFEQKVAASLPDGAGGGEAIARVWAREKIAALTRAEASQGSQEKAITAIALEHHLVTQYTSLVAIDQSEPARPGAPPKRVEQPAEAPEGVNLTTAGGRLAEPPSSAPGPTFTGEATSSTTSVAQPASPPSPAPPPPSEPAPASRPSEDVAAASPAAVHRGGGCAGCAVASSTPSRGTATLVLLALALLGRARRRARTTGRE